MSLDQSFWFLDSCYNDVAIQGHLRTQTGNDGQTYGVCVVALFKVASTRVAKYEKFIHDVHVQCTNDGHTKCSFCLF